MTVNGAPDPEDWLAALRTEWALLGSVDAGRPVSPLRTLYVGGGTPSLLGPRAMPGLVDLFGPELLQDPALEWTAEANPESLTAETAAAWRRAGVNRISMGAQTFHAESLRWMGRMHGPDGPQRAMQIARDNGFEAVSIDLIFALPVQLNRSLDSDLDQLLALAPPHVSIYGLSVEAGTPLGRSIREGRELPVDEGQYADEFLLLTDRLRGEGYHHYEVSNFAKPGFESVHNRTYWTGEDYLGLGNGAHSFQDGVRRWNIRDWAAYSTAVGGGVFPEEGRETIGPRERQLERIWLSLRTSDGLSLSGLSDAGSTMATDWIRKGNAEIKDGTVRLTPQGWLLLDQLAVALDEVEGEPPADSVDAAHLRGVPADAPNRPRGFRP